MRRDDITLYFAFLGMGSSVATVISASANNAPAALMFAIIVLISVIVTLALIWTDK